MATSQPGMQNQQSARKGGVAAQGAASSSPDTDIEEDEIYGLVSVLYHALQGASAARKYINDAQEADDEELKDFFQRCRQDDAARASEAKRLLVSRVDEEDDEDEAGSSSASGESESDEDEDEDDEDEEDDEA